MALVEHQTVEVGREDRYGEKAHAVAARRVERQEHLHLREGFDLASSKLDLFLELAAHRLLRALARLDRAAEAGPVTRQHDVRNVVAVLHEVAPVRRHQQRRGDVTPLDLRPAHAGRRRATS